MEPQFCCLAAHGVSRGPRAKAWDTSPSPPPRGRCTGARWQPPSRIPVKQRAAFTGASPGAQPRAECGGHTHSRTPAPRKRREPRLHLSPRRPRPGSQAEGEAPGGPLRAWGPGAGFELGLPGPSPPAPNPGQDEQLRAQLPPEQGWGRSWGQEGPPRQIFSNIRMWREPSLPHPLGEL